MSEQKRNCKYCMSTYMENWDDIQNGKELCCPKCTPFRIGIDFTSDRIEKMKLEKLFRKYKEEWECSDFTKWI